MAAATIAAAQENAKAELEEIVVFASRARTATKTDTSLMNIPQSISVVTSSQIMDRGAVNFQDVFRYSAGVVSEVNGVDVRADGLVARGFPTVQYLDGMNRMPDLLYGVRMEVFTLERAEVLRGPSAVLYGAGGAGGLFNGVSKRPEQEFGGEFGIQLGTDDRRQVQADLTGGLGRDVAARFVGVYREGELQVDGQADDRIVAMPSLSWSPTSDTDLTFILLYQKDSMGTQTYLPLSRTLNAQGEPALPVNFFAGEPGFNHMDTEHVSGTLLLDHNFSDALRYSGRVRYYNQSVDYAEVYADLADGFGVDPFIDPQRTLLSREFYILDETYKVLNTDNNLSYEFSSGELEHRVLLGLDYTHFKQDRQEGFSCDGFAGFGACFAGGSPPPLDITNPQYGAPFEFGFTNAYNTRSTQLGVYLQDQITYRERATLVLGLRRDRATSEVNGNREEPNEATTYRIGFSLDVGAGFSPYAGYSESFLPVFGGDFYGNPYQPREGRQYELGVKWQPDSESMVTLSLFDIEESNFTTTDPDNIQNFIQSGKLGSEGVELEAMARLWESVTFTGSYSYTQAEILSDNSGREGFRIEDLPEHLASLWATNEFDLGGGFSVRAGAGVRYTGSKTDYYNLQKTPSVTLVDALVEASYQQWRLSINATNLLDKEYYASCTAWSFPYGACLPGIHRRVLATISRRF